MTRCLVLGALLGIVCLAGCGLKHPRVGEYEAVAGDLLYLFNELTKVLEEVKDEETAHAAVAKLDALNGKFELLYQRYTNMPNMRQEEINDVEARLKTGLKEVGPKLEMAVIKAAFNAGKQAEALNGAMERVHATLDKFKKFDQLRNNRPR